MAEQVNTNLSSAAYRQQIIDLYRQNLNRTPSEQELAGWAQTFGPEIDANERAQFQSAAQPELQARRSAGEIIFGQRAGVPTVVNPTGAGSAAGTLQEQVVRESPEIEARRLGVVDSAQALASQPVDLSGAAFQVAGLTPEQVSNIQRAQQGVGAFAPFVNQGAISMGIGAGNLQEAAGVLREADVRPQFATAQAATAGSLVPTAQMGEGAGIAGLGVGQTLQGAQRAGIGDIASYMNPYQQLVTEQALRDMRRQADIAGAQQAAQAVRAGAFGGTREGVQRAEMERNVQDLMSRRIFEDASQNYAQAQNLFGQQAARQLQAGSQLGQLGGTTAGIYGQQAGLMQSLGQGIGQLAGQEFGIGQGIAAGLGSLGSQLGNIGVQQGALGQTGQQIEQAGIQFALQSSEAQRQIAQQSLDAARNTALQRAYEPYQRIGFVADIMKQAPSTQTSITAATAPQPSTAQQIAGLAAATLPAAAAANKIGLF
jgi:hypothetical protein